MTTLLPLNPTLHACYASHVAGGGRCCRRGGGAVSGVTTRGAVPPDTKRLHTFSARGPYGPHAYYDAAGAPRAATDGHALLVLGVTTVEEAVAVLAALDPATGDAGYPAPPLPSALAEAARPSIGAIAWRLAELRVDVRTEPTPRHVEAGAHGARACLVLAEEALARAEAPPAAHRSIRQARAAEVRDAKRALATRAAPLWHALDLCDVTGAPVATVDLRLVRRALHGMGVRSGVLYAVAPTRACVLVTRRGIALMMPLRV